MSRKPFKVNISFNEALKRTAEYNPKDKEKPVILPNGIIDNKNENNNKKDLTEKEEI